VILKKMISQPKVSVLTRIVVMGGGFATYPLLEGLCFHPTVTFPNLHVVMEAPLTPKLLHDPTHTHTTDTNSDDTNDSDTNGTNSVRVSNKKEVYPHGCLSCNDAYDMTVSEMQSLGLAHKIGLVRGHLTDIDKDSRCIVISNELIFEYDLLLITSAAQDSTMKRLPSLSSSHPMTAATKGVFGIGNGLMDQKALNWINKKSSTSTSANSTDSSSDIIVIYGGCLEALSAAGHLMDRGVRASDIVMVMAAFEIDVGHDAVNEFVEGRLKEMGGGVRLGWQLVDAAFGRNGHISEVTLTAIKRLERNGLGDFIETKDNSHSNSRSNDDTSGAERVRVSCGTLIMCANKQVDADTFVAINDAGLVYDGGIVVDDSFRTTDPYVFAFGPFTRYSRKYKDSTPAHEQLNIREAAEVLCQRAMDMYLDPSKPGVAFERSTNSSSSTNTNSSSYSNRKGSSSSSSSSSSSLPPLPTFKAPKSVNTKLPGGLVYFRST
jgi:hypothetical protein